MSSGETQALLGAQQSDYQTVDHLSDRQPLSGCEKVALVGKMAFWFIASIATVFRITDHPWNRVTEIWTQLTKEEGVSAVRPAQLSVDSFDIVENLHNRGHVFQSGALFKKSTTYAYMNYLESQYGKEATFLKGLVDPSTKVNYVEGTVVPAVVQAIEEGKHFVFIPIVHESVSDHIVLLTLNLKNGGIEYYDPKGNGPGTENISALDMSVSAFRQAVSYAVFLSVNRIRGEKLNPALVELRDLLAVKGDGALQQKISDNLTKHAQALTGNSKLFVSLRDFATGNPIPLLQSIVKAYDADDRETVQKKLRDIGFDKYKLSVPMRECLSQATRYSDTPEVQRAFNSLKIAAEGELEWQSNLSDAMNREINERGRQSSPFHCGTWNTSSPAKHQKSKDKTNCGAFVAKFMKERIKQSKVDRGKLEVWQSREDIDFRATQAAIGDSRTIRTELAKDLSL